MSSLKVIISIFNRSITNKYLQYIICILIKKNVNQTFVYNLFLVAYPKLQLKIIFSVY